MKIRGVNLIILGGFFMLLFGSANVWQKKKARALPRMLPFLANMSGGGRN